MANATVDTVKLTATINKCFANAIDDRFSDAEKNNFLLGGRRLQAQLITLLSAQFDAGSAPLAAANATLGDVNDKLEDDAAVLANVAAVFGEISTLVTSLDSLLTAAVSFV